MARHQYSDSPQAPFWPLRLSPMAWPWSGSTCMNRHFASMRTIPPGRLIYLPDRKRGPTAGGGQRIPAITDVGTTRSKGAIRRIRRCHHHRPTAADRGDGGRIHTNVGVAGRSDLADLGHSRRRNRPPASQRHPPDTSSSGGTRYRSRRYRGGHPGIRTVTAAHRGGAGEVVVDRDPIIANAPSSPR